MRSILAVLFSTVLLLPATTLQAQAHPPVAPGDRVRLASEEVRGIFTVVSLDGDDLVVRRPEARAPIALAVSDLDRLEVDRGLRSRRSSAARGAIFGAMAGGVTGIIVGFADGDDRCDPRGWCFFQMSAGEKAAVGGLIFGSAGSLVGVAVGALLPGRRWESCALPLEVGLNTSAPGGPGLAATIRF